MYDLSDHAFHRGHRGQGDNLANMLDKLSKSWPDLSLSLALTPDHTEVDPFVHLESSSNLHPAVVPHSTNNQPSDVPQWSLFFVGNMGDIGTNSLTPWIHWATHCLICPPHCPCPPTSLKPPLSPQQIIVTKYISPFSPLPPLNPHSLLYFQVSESRRR